jgi:hypothetical protein
MNIKFIVAVFVAQKFEMAANKAILSNKTIVSRRLTCAFESDSCI